MKRGEAINKVNEGVGSIYTKEDVINLINQIEDTQAEIHWLSLYPRQSWMRVHIHNATLTLQKKMSK